MLQRLGGLSLETNESWSRCLAQIDPRNREDIVAAASGGRICKTIKVSARNCLRIVYGRVPRVAMPTASSPATTVRPIAINFCRSIPPLLVPDSRPLAIVADVVNYVFPQNWPADRERRARIIGEWLQTEARFLA